MMKSGWKILVSIGILALLFIVIPWKDVWLALLKLSFGYWMALVIVFIAGHLLGVQKWRMLVNAGVPRLKQIDALRCYAAGLFANLCLPTIVGGDVLRAALAGKATQRPEAAILGGTADRISDFAATVLLIAGGGILSGRMLPWGDILLLPVLLLLFALAATGIPFLFRRPLSRWPAPYRRTIARILIALRRFWRTPQIAFKALFLSLAIQATFVLLNAWIGYCIGIHISLTVWFLVWPLAKLAALVPITMGGLGVREATQAALLLPFGVPTPHALAGSLIWQTVLIAGGLAGGLTWVLLRNPKEKQTDFIPDTESQFL